MRPRIKMSDACKEQEKEQVESVENIYLGNLKKGFKKGKERFTGNVLIEPFLSIPEKFISISGRTGKKVIRIVIDENKEGVDMYGFTHNIRVDSFISGIEMDSDLKNETIFEIKELRCSKLGISESKIFNQNDKNILKNWKIAIDKEIGEISTSIDVKINGCKLDNDTYLKMKKTKRNLGILSQQIQTRLSEVKKEHHNKDEIRFRDIAKEILPADVFMSIIERIRELENNN